MSLHPRGRRLIKATEAALQKSAERFFIDDRQRVWFEVFRCTDRILLPGGGESALGVANGIVDLRIGRQRAKRFDRHAEPRGFGNRVSKFAQRAGERFDIGDVTLQRLV
jgi:hypothetical protein